eukprot:CAMPEP_0201137502 /NCGR_PEP_ID=MMETSP0850-20130426/55444_1 /ASSEMBLY_ACC=CAM_ASM_000622 /TAXON_ID=183588 /ORGANISM="Pseudo-nitzschia fraudulenta, Strain WWA7" /LENGTH=315 /DNA_ID=CAMNT_0047408861 /DNA_START=214 /DNA_END=1161 /DNA_ORIENTATION=+
MESSRIEASPLANEPTPSPTPTPSRNQRATATTKIAPPRVTAVVAAFVLLALAAGGGRTNHAAEAAAAPTCRSLGTSWYFPNDCVASCSETHEGSTMDTDRSRNVGGDFRCFCEGVEGPFCTDDPACADLEILPGNALEGCASACGDSATVTDAIEYAGDESAASKNVTHFVVACYCGGSATPKCGTDYVFFSDLTYLPSCTTGTAAATENALGIASAPDCASYCSRSSAAFVAGDWEGSSGSCTCSDAAGRSAVACDDSAANFNDGSGLGNPCYESVGVTSADCSPAAPPAGTTAAAKTLVSSTAIMGVWLLPW